MKVICCFIPGTLRDETIEALTAYARNVHLIVIDSKDQRAYGKTIAKHWRMGEDFMIVEPDIVVREDVMEAFETCDCNYGAFPYAWTTNVGPALGCTWFRSEFLAAYPKAADEAATFSWRQFDVVLMRHVLARTWGEQPHVHLPAVVHLNEEKQLLPDADPTPMMEVPLW
jgi:hypothetical protein